MYSTDILMESLGKFDARSAKIYIEERKNKVIIALKVMKIKQNIVD